MGYCVDMSDNSFSIKNEDKEKALQALKCFAVKHPDLSWVNSKIVFNAKNLYEALEECRYTIEEDANGDVIDIFFEGEKLGNDFDIFSSIAPFVKNGAYIEMQGEDGCLWRWVFKDGKCQEITPKITWDEE